MKDFFSDCQQPEEWVNSFREFAKELQGFMLFAGKNGTGKSFAAHCIMNASGIWDTDLKMFTTQSELNIKWQKQLTEWGETNYLLQQIIKTELLVLDDVGTRTPSDAFMDFLYAIVDARYSSGRGTIITTNLNSTDMRAKFGDAFVSRVASGQVFRFEGEDRRFDKINF